MMMGLIGTITDSLRGDTAATMVEYGLLIALIAVACVGAITAFGVGVNPLFVVPGLSL